MKRLLIAALLALGTSASLPAQQSSLLLSGRASQPAIPFAASASNFSLVPELAIPAASAVSFAYPSLPPALPEAPARPQSYSDDIGNRWELAVGYEFVHFESAPFSANLHGLHTDLSYNLNEWFALKGGVVSAFGSDVFGGETSKYVLYAVGGRIGWGLSRRRLTPWAHALVGGVHVNPQTAHESKDGFALQLGGGADWRVNARFSIRGEVDYVRTWLYSDSQNNIQAGVGAVLHF
jgi:Outer membrane protein beta-barrel domain